MRYTRSAELRKAAVDVHNKAHMKHTNIYKKMYACIQRYIHIIFATDAFLKNPLVTKILIKFFFAHSAFETLKRQQPIDRVFWFHSLYKNTKFHSYITSCD